MFAIIILVMLVKTYIKGNFRRSIFSSDNGYVIGLFKVKDTNDEELEDYVNKTITFTGYFHELNLDDLYMFYGEMIEHPKYGMQFQVSEYERLKPEDKDGIIAFLASDLFNGVGEKLAKQIVDTLGDDTLDKILADVDNLLLVPKMTKKKALKIYDTLTKYEESHKTIVYLNELGFNMKDSLLIYNKYKADTIRNLDSDIFRFLDDIPELSFIKLDEIALKMQMAADDERRIKACIFYIMKELTFKTGDTYFLLEEITYQVERYLKISRTIDYDYYMHELVLEGKVYIVDDKYYLKELYLAEMNIARTLLFLNAKAKSNYPKLDKWLEAIEEENTISYNEKQKEAIKSALTDNVLVITGGPGTGKTTIIKAIVLLYQILNDCSYEQLLSEVALLAPTGRASKRIGEATLLPATTIHRFLKWNKETNSFGVNEYEKAPSKLVIIDESSMIDTLLFDNLLKGLTEDIKLVIVGDYNQLPSVGPGTVLKDIIESGVIKTIELDLLYRQSDNSYINTLAHEIKESNLSDRFLKESSDYAFLKCDSSLIKETLKDVCLKLKETGYDNNSFQVMAPMYGGENGIDRLNKELQEVLNPKSSAKKELLVGDVTYRENDKVLELVNMPDENIFNGDVGIIKAIRLASETLSKKNEITIDFDGNEVTFQAKDFSNFKHGFIISIHKSQGSEFDTVIIPFTMAYKRMLYRKLIYTAITRAKKKLILLGNEQAFIYGVKNASEYIRKTDLCNKLTSNQYIFLNH